MTINTPSHSEQGGNHSAPSSASMVEINTATSRSTPSFLSMVEINGTLSSMFETAATMAGTASKDDISNRSEDKKGENTDAELSSGNWSRSSGASSRRARPRR